MLSWYDVGCWLKRCSAFFWLIGLGDVGWEHSRSCWVSISSGLVPHARHSNKIVIWNPYGCRSPSSIYWFYCYNYYTGYWT
jgi:hypothetical protein